MRAATHQLYSSALEVWYAQMAWLFMAGSNIEAVLTISPAPALSSSPVPANSCLPFLWRILLSSLHRDSLDVTAVWAVSMTSPVQFPASWHLNLPFLSLSTVVLQPRRQIVCDTRVGFGDIFTEPAHMPDQSINHDVRVFVCLSVCVCVFASGRRHIYINKYIHNISVIRKKKQTYSLTVGLRDGIEFMRLLLFRNFFKLIY